MNMSIIDPINDVLGFCKFDEIILQQAPCVDGSMIELKTFICLSGTNCLALVVNRRIQPPSGDGQPSGFKNNDAKLCRSAC